MRADFPLGEFQHEKWHESMTSFPAIANIPQQNDSSLHLLKNDISIIYRKFKLGNRTKNQPANP